MRARAAAIALVTLAACGRAEGPAPAASGSASASAVAPASSSRERLDAILAAEQRRAAAGITAADQQSRDALVRRAAARALARIGGEGAQAGLLRALADEDEEVAAWGAYGLGFFCKGHEKENVSALVARALAQHAAPASASVTASVTASASAPASASAIAAIARAVGRCAAEESEPTLVAWLAGPRERAVAAALALGDLGASRQKLREETYAALLNLAAGSAAAPPVPEALFPIGRLDRTLPGIWGRLREVAAARLAEPGDARLFAVRALGRADLDAAPDLARVLTTAGAFTPAERAEAARALKRLGRAGQRALADALPGLAPAADPVSLTALVGPDFGVLLAVLDALEAPGPARKILNDLATLPPPPGAPASVVRRVAWLRCGAAKLLAGDDFRSKALAECDPAGPSGSIGARAAVEVIGRGEITGARLTAWRSMATGGDLRAREAALELLESHEEIEGAALVLADALRAKEGGLVATAAEVIAKQPQRAAGDAPVRKVKRGKKKKAKAEEERARVEIGAPSPALVKALLDALSRPGAADDPEAVDSLVDAAGALALKEARGRLDELCRSPYPTTREHAQKALGLLGEKRACEAPSDGGPLPAEIGRLAPGAVTLSFDTDAGAMTMTLDPSLAPVAVARAVELARSGYYDGMVVHRVVPGFVTQFGAPHGDGFGGPDGQPALRCETSPLPFVPLAVGVALAGRDTGSSQLFVTHARTPHLDGNYALVGTATGAWNAFADGDLIRKVTVSP